MAGILCERAGVVNIAIEGMMLMGAMVGALVGSVTDNLWIGLLAGVLAGVLLGLVHGVLSIKYKINQIISGTVINIFAAGMTSYISAKFLQVNQELNNPGTFPLWEIPVLSDIPFFGPLLFNNNMFVYGMFILLCRAPDRAVLHPLGAAHALGGRAPKRRRYPGHQRLPHALHGGAPGRHDGRALPGLTSRSARWAASMK